jgi:hypothetical protein
MDIKTQSELYDDFILELQSQAPDLTDTNEGSEIDVLGGVVSTGVDEILKLVLDKFKKTFFSTAEDTDLEYLAKDHFGDSFARPQAAKAVGVVTFSRPNTLAGNVSILVGTIVKTPANAAGKSQRFTVTSAVTMTGLTINASVEAVLAGIDGNVQDATITQIETTLTDSSVTVNNAADFVGGAEAEDDSQYRETIRQLIQALSGATAAAIKAKALTVSGVELATCVEILQYVKEWNISGNNPVGAYFAIPRAKLYIADANGTASGALITAVSDAIEYTRACGVRVDVIGAVPITINWSATLTLNPAGLNYATLQTDTSMVVDEMTKYIQDLDIGSDFDRGLARLYIMNKFGAAGTDDLTDFVTNVPTGNISLLDNEKTIVGTITA